MASSLTSEVILSDEDYRKLATDTFQKYARVDIEDSLLLEAIQIDFEHWTKENWEAIDGNTWMTIKQHCIPRGVWIDHYGNNGTRAEILMKLVSTEYDDDLKDWDMNRIKQVEKTYDKVSRAIQLRKQELLVQQAALRQVPPTEQAPLTKASPVQAFPIQAPLTQALPMQVTPTEATPIQAPPIQVPPTPAPPIQAPPAPERLIQSSPTSAPSAPNEPGRGQPGKHREQVHIASPSDTYFLIEECTNKDADDQPPQYTASRQKEIAGSLETKSPTIQRDITQAYIQSTSSIDQDFYIRPPCEQVSLLGSSSDVPEASTTWFATHHPHYKERPGMTESAHDPFLLRPPLMLLSLPGASSDCGVKFATYHPHYKEILGITESAYNPSPLWPPPSCHH